MLLYEIMDCDGNTIMELGRFLSDDAAKRVSRHVIIPRGAAYIAKKTGSGHIKVTSVVASVETKKKPTKAEILADLLRACKKCSDQRIAQLAGMYET